MDAPIVFAMIDGLTPELGESMDCMRSYSMAEVTPYLGYSPACHASMLTGVPPALHGHWFLWNFGPQSPDLLTRTLSFLPFAGTSPTRLALRALVHAVGATPPTPIFVNRRTMGFVEYANLNPWKAKQIGDYETLLGTASRLGEHVQSVGVGDTAPAAEAAMIERSYPSPMTNVFFFSFGEVDHSLHKFGIGSPHCREAARVVDNVILRKLKEIRKVRQLDPKVLIASDHGHVSVTSRIDIVGRLRRTGFPLTRLPFIVDTTMARFKVADHSSRTRLEKALDNLGVGMTLSETAARKYGVPLGGRHGDVVFTLTEPTVFSRTIWGFSLMQSMHGYPPDIVPHPGVVASSRGVGSNRVDLATVHNLFLQMVSRLSQTTTEVN